LIPILAGAVAGVLILGLGGRIGMALIAIGSGTDLNLSLRGILEVLFVGILIGTVGGLLLVPVRIVFPTNRLTRGIIIGVLLLSGSLLMSWFTGGLKLDLHSVLPLTLVVVSIIFIFYGVVIDALLTRFERIR